MLLLVRKYNTIKVFTGLQLYMNIFFCISTSVITQYESSYYIAISPVIILLHGSISCCIMRLPHYNFCPVLGSLVLLVLLCMHISVRILFLSMKSRMFINQLIHFLYMETLKLSFMFLAIDINFFAEYNTFIISPIPICSY